MKENWWHAQFNVVQQNKCKITKTWCCTTNNNWKEHLKKLTKWKTIFKCHMTKN